MKVALKITASLLHWNRLKWDPKTSTWKTRENYNDAMIGAMASQITSLTIVNSTVYARRRSIQHQSSASLAFVMGHSPVTGEFPARRSSNAEIVSICWRHHDALTCMCVLPFFARECWNMHCITVLSSVYILVYISHIYCVSKTLSKSMLACCKASHYLSQCWLVVNKITVIAIQ